MPSASEAPIVLADYDPAWPVGFERERVLGVAQQSRNLL